MEIGQFFNIKNKTKLNINDMTNIGETIKFAIALPCILGNLCNIVSIKITIPIVVTTIKNPLGSWLGISSSLPSMVRNFPSVNVTLEKCLTMIGIPIKVVQKMMKTYGGNGLALPKANIKNKPIPSIKPIPNMRFQKLDLFMRESQKVFWGCLVKLGAAISTLGSIASAFTCLGFVSMLKGLVKSCMSVISNYEFNISVIIVSGIRLLSKGITGTILFLSIFILWNTCAYATDTASSNTPPSKGYWLKKYIGAVEQKNRIPKGLLSAIAGVESDFNPYAVNIAGKTVIASNQEEAAKTIRHAINSGITNIDVGIAQINYRWHKDNFKNIDEMINPATNIEYAAKLLLSLFKQHGTWHKAIRHYHSANPDHHRRYSRKVVIAWLGNSQLIK
jgi:hypothetical protein